jgi:GNAT superfamily N-acetyltransferase
MTDNSLGPESVENIFCTTGKGGGIDPSCGSGGKRGGGGTPAEVVGGRSVRDAAEDFFGSADKQHWATAVGAPPGATVTVFARASTVEVRVDHPSYKAEYRFNTDAEGGGKRVKINAFYVNDGAKGQGLGTQVIHDQAQFLAQHGFKLMRLDAARSNSENENGYYSWPRLGFDKTLTPTEKMDLPAAHQGVSRVSDLMKTKDGREAWLKHGDTLRDMEFDLAPGSPANQVLAAYVKEREARQSPPQALQPVTNTTGAVAGLWFSDDDDKLLDEIWDRLARADVANAAQPTTDNQERAALIADILAFFLPGDDTGVDELLAMISAKDKILVADMEP